MAPEAPDQDEQDGQALTYLHRAYEELELSPPEQLLFDAHLIGAVTWHVPDAAFIDAVDQAVGWLHRWRARPL